MRFCGFPSVIQLVLAISFSLISFSLLGCQGGAPSPNRTDAGASGATGADAAVEGGQATKPDVTSQRQALPWPTLPRTAEGAQNLARTSILRPARFTRRKAELDASELFARTPPAKLAHAIVGEGPIREALRTKVSAGAGDGYLIVGSHHGSRAQLEAFRRLVEVPGSYDYVMLEAFAADGHWSGMADAEQRGATAALEDYAKKGDAESFGALQKAHDTSDYVSWKLGCSSAVVDLAVVARAGAFALLAADMSPSMKRTLAPLGDALLDVREMHAALTLRALLSGDRPRSRVATLWGDLHVGEAGLPRFLPRSATVVMVHILGATPGESAPTKKLEGRLVLDEPVLFPLSEVSDELVLMLPDGYTSGDVERVRTTAEAPAPNDAAVAVAVVTVIAEERAKLWLGEVTYDLLEKPTTLRLAPGSMTYVVETKGTTVVGSLSVVAGEATSLSVAPKKRQTRVEHRLPGPSR